MENITLKNNPTALLESRDSLDHLCGVKILMFVLWHSGVEIRKKSGNSHVVSRFVCRGKKIRDGGGNEGATAGR